MGSLMSIQRVMHFSAHKWDTKKNGPPPSPPRHEAPARRSLVEQAGQLAGGPQREVLGALRQGNVLEAVGLLAFHTSPSSPNHVRH